MRTFLTISLALFFCIGLLSSPAIAIDEDSDLLDDSVVPESGNQVPDASVAIVNTGDGSVANYQTRLATAGYAATLIPLNSGYAVLSQYDMVLLPVSHARVEYYPTLDGLSSDYHDYVANGGRLWIGQPNPYLMPNNEAVITWAPYYLRLNNGYSSSDCPTVIVDPDHCIAQGISGSDLPFAGDTVLEMAAEWHVVAQGPSTGRPAVFTSCYGAGACMVELGHPSSGSFCAYTDLGFSNMVECLLDPGASGTESSSWGEVKSEFK